MAVCLGSGGCLSGAPLSPAEVQVKLNVLPAGASLTAVTRLTEGPGSSQYLQVVLKNESPTVVALVDASITFPWLPSEASQVASGGSTMYTWPTQVGGSSDDVNAKRGSGTYLLARHDAGYSLAAFLTWNTFWSTLACNGAGVRVKVDGEGRHLQPGEQIALEKVWLGAGPDWQDLLFQSGREIARELKVRLKPQPHYVGWSTWDYFGRDWTARNVKDNLAVLAQVVPEANLVQIDGGWWVERGDYLQVRDNLKPEGMKGLATFIRSHQLTPGIHFDGMRADRASKMVQEHPEFFMHDDRGDLVGPRRSGNPNRGIVFFDFSHPGALAYMRDVTRQMRQAWGFDYIKIDFLLPGIAANVRLASFKNEPERLLMPHDRGTTSVERLRAAMRAWREGMGDEAFLLACSAPFGPVFGLADGLRSGYDVAPNFSQVRQCAQATAGVFHFHGQAIWNDADYHVVRAAEDEDASVTEASGKHGRLALNEAEMWTHYIGLFGGAKISSDNLPTLRPERRRLFREALALPACGRFIPLDFWARARNRDDAYHVMLGEAKGEVYLAIFNWSDSPREYRFRGLPPSVNLIAGEAEQAGDASECRIHLVARHSVVYRLPTGADFDHLRHQIQIDL